MLCEELATAVPQPLTQPVKNPTAVPHEWIQQPHHDQVSYPSTRGGAGA
ncbi:hypothetical protein [Streptomyces rubradiris]|nr:hypothetical protein [Streptomyces rubradiris]